ncbi:hypothetical protein CHARACLAT_019253, partial [Characodon lateralis]|nr:hypothetical protein [Characodon lateralis]
IIKTQNAISQNFFILHNIKIGYFICYEGQTVYFNQDYTTEIQKKRKQVRDIIKQLRERNVKTRSPYPAKLKVFLDTGTKTFTTVEQAVPMLKEMGISVKG